MTNKEKLTLVLMFVCMMSVIGCGVTMFAGAFFVQAVGVGTAFAMPVSFAVLALVCKFFVDELEA
jgi:hypothetical protein